MKKLLVCVLVLIGFDGALANNSLSTINSFAPGSSQINFVSVETSRTLDHKHFSFLGFLDSSYQSLSIYNSAQTGDDVLSFTHLGLSYGLSRKLEIGVKGSAIFNQTSNSSQSSLVLAAKGFVNVDGFAKYRLLDTVKSGLSLMTQVGVANGDEIFFVGPGSGLTYSLSMLFERSLGSWLLATNLGYIQRSPGQQEGLAFFEPIQSSIVGSFGLGRPITKSTRISGEILLASHDYVKDRSDRSGLSSEALLSFHTKLKSVNLSYGLGTGLTDGISTPTARGFLGFQYSFGPGQTLAEKEEPVEDEGFESENMQDEVASIEAEPSFEEETIEVTEQPQIMTDEEDDAFADLTEENIEEVFEAEGKPVQVAQEPTVEEVVVTETVESIMAPKKKSATAHKFILDNVEFDFDSDRLNSSSLKTLAKVMEEIKKVSFKSIKIWGHTDFFGPSIYNEYLGLRRAKAVFDYFKKAGIPDPFIDYDAFGERRPATLGITDQERRKNRRVEIIIFMDGE